jgi:hypothetical protein
MPGICLCLTSQGSSGQIMAESAGEPGRKKSFNSMKTLFPIWSGKVPFFALVLVCVAASSFAQTNTNTFFPVVTIRATDNIATYSGNTGTFTVFRDGSTNSTLNLFYRIDGTASNGVDYATIPNTITIPAGVRTNSILISPINNGQTDNKTVVLTLSQPPGLPAVNYQIGNPSNAVVIIATNGPSSNIPPVVRISMPTNGSVFLTPVDIHICADAGDIDGYVATVEFFAGTNSLGIRTNNPMSVGPANPFCLVWSNAPVGDAVLTALATDNGGASTRSEPVKISVLQGPPPTNIPPVVRIASPPNGATFYAPVNIPIYAFANDKDGFVTSVEFFAGTNDLGAGQKIVCTNRYFTNCATCPVPVCPTNDWLLIWSNAPLGTYPLIAVATDNGGASTRSEVVTVSILPPRPPPTNRPPIVSIYAIDPIAVEGTNCWVRLCPTNVTATGWVGWSNSCRLCTNCGPKNAAFEVRRFGETNDDVSVSYRIGGTASNGVDYVALSGSVTIPAGERRALIPIVPIDDGPPDISTTVILKLLPSPTTNYLVGFPAAAAVLIIDSTTNWPPTAILPDHCFHLSGLGPDGNWFHVEYSVDMANWTSICTNQVVNGSIDFVDPDAQTEQVRFYRAVPESAPPPQ